MVPLTSGEFLIGYLGYSYENTMRAFRQPARTVVVQVVDNRVSRR